jgi:hypothetical protein
MNLRVLSELGSSIADFLVTATSTVYSFVQPLGNKVQLIDTPGFNDTTVTDSDVLRDIVFMLTQTYHRGIRLAGIIYLHRITDIRVSGSSKKMMKVIQDLVGEEAFPRLVLASTMWQHPEDDPDAYEIAVRREAELQFTGDFWGAMCRGGSKVMRWDGSRDSAMAMVDCLSSLQSRSGSVTLQIQREMVELNMDLSDTKAGQTVNASISELATKSRRELGRVDTKLQEEMAIRQENHDLELEAMKEDYERKISEARKVQDKLKVDFENLSKQKLKECEDMLQTVAQDMEEMRSRRERKELENAQVDQEKAENDEFRQTELEYNKARLKDLEDRIENLKACGETKELNSAMEEHERLKGVCKQFLKQHEDREMDKRRRQLEVASLQGEETRLGKMQLALQAFGVLAGIGLTVAGAVTGIFPLVGGGISLASNSVSSIKRRGRRN